MVSAGPRQIAVPIQRVSVGVTNIRRKLFFDFVPRTQPAPILVDAVDTPINALGIWAIASHQAVAMLVELHGRLASRASGEIGQMAGIVTQYGVTQISTLVRAAKIGIPWFTAGALPIEVQSTDIAFPGASGAQLIGDERHPPPPNPQESPSARFCIAVSICFSTFGLNPMVAS